MIELVASHAVLFLDVNLGYLAYNVIGKQQKLVNLPMVNTCIFYLGYIKCKCTLIILSTVNNIYLANLTEHNIIIIIIITIVIHTRSISTKMHLTFSPSIVTCMSDWISIRICYKTVFSDKVHINVTA